MEDGDERRKAREAVERRRRMQTRIGQAIDYVFFVLYGLIATRFVLALIHANENAGFVRFLHALTGPFYGPFSSIVETQTVGGLVVDFSAIIALLVYMLVHIAALGLLRLVFGQPLKPTP